MKRSIRYDVDYVFAGFDNIEKYGHWTYHDEITDLELKNAGENIENLVFTGQMLDEIFATEIFYQYVTQLLGAPCVTTNAIFEHLHNEDDGVYTLGSLSVSLMEPTYQLDM